MPSSLRHAVIAIVVMIGVLSTFVAGVLFLWAAVATLGDLVAR